MWSRRRRPAGRPAGARAMAVARPTESASITQPHAYVNSIGLKPLSAVGYAQLAKAAVRLAGRHGPWRHARMSTAPTPPATHERRPCSWLGTICASAPLAAAAPAPSPLGPVAPYRPAGPVARLPRAGSAGRP